MNRFLLISCNLLLLWWLLPKQPASKVPEIEKALPNLSDYGLFKGPLAAMQPADGVLSYELNAPLFSDYAEKARFIKLPAGQKMQYSPDEVFQFPVGTVIAKTFSYHADARKPKSKHRLLETRILVHTENGWQAWPYIWNEDQTDAALEITGGILPIEWKDEQGKKRSLQYSVPNVNQCKGCHSFNKQIVPIGPSARQLNHQISSKSGKVAQLEHWRQQGLIEGLPAKAGDIPALTTWSDNGPDINSRARAYLDANCGHCHRPEGPGSTSGLFLPYAENDPGHLGVMKAPVAAGRGAGNRSFNIVPGKPEASILLYRMESSDPGVMMPELGRQMTHQEGIELLKAWIRQLQ